MSEQCGVCSGNSIFEIFTGQDKTMSLRAAYSSGLPLDLTSCTEISVPLPNADGTTSIRLLSLSQVVISSPAISGMFTVPIPSAVSALLNIGERQTIDVSFTISGLITIVRYFRALTVVQSN